MLKQRLPAFSRGLKIPVDIFHHDHGGIDNDAEIDRAERQQVGVFALQHQNDDGEKQRERNVGADDDGAAQIAEKHPLNDENQQAAEDQVVQHRVRGDPDQEASIVVGNDLDARRQAAVAVELYDLGLDFRNDVVGVLGSSHHHDGGGDVVIVISAPNAEPRPKTDGDAGDVLDLDRQAVHLGQDDVLDVLDLVALGDVVGAAAIDESDAADIDRLLPDRDLTTADIDVGVTERGDELRDRDVVGFQLLQIGIDIELLGHAAPGVDLHHTRNRQEAPGDDVIFQRAQIGQAEMRGTDELIAIDFPDQTRLLDLRDLVARQVDVLLQTDRGLGQREVEVGAISERDADERQAIERGRADVDDARRRVKADLHRDRVVFFHFLGGKTRRLRCDLQDDRGRIGIGFDVQL